MYTADVIPGEIWESNFSVDLPPSPDLSQRLCRMVVKQGVLVRLLNTDVASASGAPADLLKLYNIPDSDVEVCLNTELTKVLEEVEKRILEEGILVSTLEDIVEWVIRYSKSLHVYKLRAELEARRFDRRHISAVDIGTESGTRRILITPPEPLSIIITAGHGRRYAKIYTFLTDLTRAAFALSQVELREHHVSPECSRQLFYCCSTMLRVISGARDHVLAELDSVWQVFLDDLNSVGTIDHAINAHRRAMKSMMQRTLLDVSNLTTGRTVEVMCESCVRFAQAMNAGDESSAFIHYRCFDDHAQLLREKLSVERANIYARTLLWRIGNSGEFLEEEDEDAVPDDASQLPSKNTTFRSLRDLSRSATQLIY
ncbi:hypothetical protein ANCDUO_00896 [Ancylostoma duodenale]|uniref:Gamma tubulin complex component C-terminal domain-containing protein n=1 Tax=Ancylostoma duodenale TaxID=51022 RepID=A0A0C2H4N8_9BILA|nr:hypothetical protein ANCDUO_00896 [Ancylostoma duodenale]